MSRLSDAAAVLQVISNVLSRTAAIQRAARQDAWKASTVMRDLGHERSTVNTFVQHNDEAVPQEPVVPIVKKERNHPSAEAKEQVPVVPIMQEQKASQSASQAASQTIEPKDDIFLLRHARHTPTAGQADRLKQLKRSPGIAKPNVAWRTEVPQAQEAALAEEVQTSSILHRETAKMHVPQPEATPAIDTDIDPPLQERTPSALQSSAVPSSRLSRLYHYTTLGSSLALNAFSDSTKRLFVGGNESQGGLMSSKNIDLLVRKLSRMRGAALKLGQMISFQSENLPLPIQQILQRVQDSADYMPAWQLNRVMSAEFGADWREEKFASFEDIPMAAASIGQVHKALLHDGTQVAVKVQYPGVANSISSDLKNLSLLLTASRLLPKGLYLDKTIANARTELAWECDYVREAENTRLFRQLVGEDPTFKFHVSSMRAQANKSSQQNCSMVWVLQKPNTTVSKRVTISAQRLCVFVCVSLLSSTLCKPIPTGPISYTMKSQGRSSC